MKEVSDCQSWAVVRLATMQKKLEQGRLLFATVTELAQDRPLPTRMEGFDSFPLNGTDEQIHFRRTILSKEDAVSWYRSLGSGESKTPVPTLESDRHAHDGDILTVPSLKDVQPWPSLGLPIHEDLFSGPGGRSIESAPFIGSVPGRLHRRFGDRTGLEIFLKDPEAQAFITRRMHINLFDYQEYLGSAVYVAPDPIIDQVDNFMVPAMEGHGERIIYRFLPRAGQSLDGLKITTFDKEARLLTGFETINVPSDGILDIDKGSCIGEYGFVVTHDKHGILMHHPLSGFLRQMNFTMRAHSNTHRKVRVRSGDSPDSPTFEYAAAGSSTLASKSVWGDAIDDDATTRINVEVRKRERLEQAKHFGQRWFDAGSRLEALAFVQTLLKGATSRIIIADPYLSELQVNQFLYAVHGEEVNVSILTTNQAFNTKDKNSKQDALASFMDSLAQLKKHQKLEPKVTVISESALHDRFLIIDSEVWFVGSSLNSLGEKSSMIVRLPNPDEVIIRLEILADTGHSLASYAGMLRKSSKARQ